MRISFCCSDTKPQPWVDGLKAAFPDADVTLWSAGGAGRLRGGLGAAPAVL
jgi:glyoxylate/hydroxypyruvate reductase A